MQFSMLQPKRIERLVSCRNQTDVRRGGSDVFAMPAGKQSEGRDTLPNLASEVAESDYRNLPFEEKQSYLNSLEECRRERAAARIISKSEINKNFSSTLANLDPEVRTLTGDCDYAHELTKFGFTDHRAE